MASLASQNDERAMRSATRAEKNAQRVSQANDKKESVTDESSNFDEERQQQAGKLAEFTARNLNGSEGKQAFHIIQLGGAEALFMSDIGTFNAESAVEALKEEGHDVHFLSVNLHLLCGGQGYKSQGQSETDPDDSWDCNERLLPYGKPPSYEDIECLHMFTYEDSATGHDPEEGCLVSVHIGKKSKVHVADIQSIMACTPEQHNKRASFGSEIDVGHRVMILSVDDKGNACVDVVRGHLNKGIDAFYEFPDVEEIKEVIKKR